MEEYKEFEPIVETTVYVKCPHCGQKASTISEYHIDKNGYEFPQWLCDNDNCGKGYSLKCENGKFFVKKTEGYKERRALLLKHGNIGIVVKGYHYNSSGEFINPEEQDEHNAYYYNEHTCPTNYIGDVVKIIDIENKDDDPHGIFEYIASAPYTVDSEDEVDMENLWPYFDASVVSHQDINKPRLNYLYLNSDTDD